MLPKHINALLKHHLIDVDKLTHYVHDDNDYWKIFNSDTLTGFELNIGHAQSDVYTLDIWSTTYFYKELTMKEAKKL